MTRFVAVALLLVVLVQSAVAVSVGIPPQYAVVEAAQNQTIEVPFRVAGDAQNKTVEFFINAPVGTSVTLVGATGSGTNAIKKSISLAQYEAVQVIPGIKIVGQSGRYKIEYGLRVSQGAGGGIGFEQVTSGSIVVVACGGNVTCANISVVTSTTGSNTTVTPTTTAATTTSSRRSGGGGGGGGGYIPPRTNTTNATKNQTVVVPSIPVQESVESVGAGIQDVSAQGSAMNEMQVDDAVPLPGAVEQSVVSPSIQEWVANTLKKGGAPVIVALLALLCVTFILGIASVKALKEAAK
jgi:hypothetical protein